MVKKLGAAVVVGLVVWLVGNYFGFLPGMQRQASAVPEAVSLATHEGDVTAALDAGAQIAPPTSTPAAVKGPLVRFHIYPWTALHGFLYSIGGPQTTKGSLMEKHGVTVKLVRQDDVSKMQAAQAQFAQALAAGSSNPREGVHFVVIMGDGSATYLAGLNKLLEPLGEDYHAEIVGSVGYSRGEDAWWGPQAWADDPSAMRGGVTSGVLRDGDWNIAQYKLANDGIKSNPDPTTYDPDAMNWVAADDFLKAVQMYVSGYCEDRKIVRGGKLTTETKRVCVQGTVTWTPGDVNLAKQKGGLVRLLSTKENAYQMPATIIGIHAWNVRNAKTVQGMLQAAFEGGDQVRSFDAALSAAGRIAFSVYGEQTAAYWVRYYKGVTERDKTGVPVPLGGSVVSNLADNLVLFGLGSGGGGLANSAFRATYEGFGAVVKKQYPELLPSFPPVDQAVNPQFVQALAATMKTDDAESLTFDDSAAEIAPESVVARRSWAIPFDTGQATFSPAARAVLAELYTQLSIGTALAVQIEGHTDNVGDPTANHLLSEARASAVKSYLQGRSAKLFPDARLKVIGKGQTAPVASNATADGRARNRRVMVVLGRVE